jgi:hypothetical protein
VIPGAGLRSSELELPPPIRHFVNGFQVQGDVQRRDASVNVHAGSQPATDGFEPCERVLPTRHE